MYAGSILASALICNACARCGDDYRKVRERRFDFMRCRNCGYCLKGLIEPHCPECGAPFPGPPDGLRASTTETVDDERPVGRRNDTDQS